MIELYHVLDPAGDLVLILSTTPDEESPSGLHTRSIDIASWLNPYLKGLFAVQLTCRRFINFRFQTQGE